MSTAHEGLFRQEALEHHTRGEIQGSLLRLTPTWVRLTYWVVAALSVTLGGLLAVVDIPEYAQGPVLIQIQGLEDITATAEGRVSHVRVSPGQHVRAGEPLVELYAQGEAAERDRAVQEFRAQLAARLMDPRDAAARQALGSLRAQVELNEARVSERTLVAPFDGWVRDVRARENQYLHAGEVVITLMKEGTEPKALAFVPGHYRPLLKPGQRVRLELDGFAYSYQELSVRAVSDELVGPTEVRRYLGPGLGDVVAVDGPRVAVEVQLPTGSFQAQGQRYAYFNGMLGTARLEVRRRNGWMMLVPALEVLGGHRG